MSQLATDQTFIAEKYTPRYAPTDRLSARYVVRRYLSKDATGELYLCVDREQSRPVTARVLHEALASEGATRAAALAAARGAMGRPEVPYVLPVVDILDAPPLLAVISPHVEGASLEDYLASYTALAADLGASLFRDIAEALLTLHKAGQVHGALCPANIWLEHKAEALVPHLRGLTDAALLPHLPALAGERAPYLAPEVRRGAAPDLRADVFAFGVCLFEALTGQRPAPGAALQVSAFVAGAPPDLDALIAQSTTADPEVRFQSVLALKNILQEISIEAMEAAEERRPERPEIGDLIAGQYQVEGMLGEGGMARVYKARDTVLGTQVAVKLLNATCLAEPEVVARFIDEASIQAQLVHPEPHPNIVAVHRVLREMPVGFVMEFVPGKTLDNYIGSADVSLVDWIEMFAQICAGLHHAHSHRIIHRDLKPSNILVATDAHGNRMAKLMDFGISKQLDQPKTRTNLILGTLGYLSPELFISARDASVQSDLYAIGCCMFEALTGQVPFPVEGGLRQLAFRVYNENPPFPSDLGAQLPPPLEALIMMCLNKDPQKRPTSSQWVCDRLLSILAERDDPALSEAIRTSGLHKKATKAPTTLRHYVSAAQLAAAQKSTQRLRGLSTDRLALSGTLPGLAAPLERPRNRLAFIALALILLAAAGLIAWLLLRPEPAPQPEPQPVAAPTQPPPPDTTTPSDLKVKPAVVLSAADLLKQAEDAAARGDLDAAQALTDQAIAAVEQAPTDPADAQALSDLYARAAALDAQRGDLNRASATLAKATALDANPSLLLKKADLDTKRGDLDGAMSSLRQFNQAANRATDDAARQKLDAEAAALKAQLLAQTEQLLDAAASAAPQDPDAARRDLARAQSLFNELSDAADTKRQAFLQKLSAAAEAASDLDTAASAHQQTQPPDDPKTFDWHMRAALLAFKRALYRDALDSIDRALPLATTDAQRNEANNLAFQAHAKLAESSSGDARLSHTLAAIPLAPSPADAAPLRAYAYEHHLAAAAAATAANDPTAALAALRAAKPFAPDLAAAKDIEKQIKRLESALKGRSKDDFDPASPIPVDQIQVWIDSTPEGASISINGKTVGKTPLIRRLPKAPDAPKILLKADGHYDEPLAIDPASGGHYQVKLKYKPPKIQ